MGRELVYHSLVDSVRVEFDDKAFLIINDPTNDSWDQDNSEGGHQRCQSYFAGNKSRILGSSNPLLELLKLHLPARGDCVYQKFLILMDAALEFGLTTGSDQVATVTTEVSEMTPPKPAPATDPDAASEAKEGKDPNETKAPKGTRAAKGPQAAKPTAPPVDDKETVMAPGDATPVTSKTTVTKTMQTKFFFCYDKAIASSYGHTKTFQP